MFFLHRKIKAQLRESFGQVKKEFFNFSTIERYFQHGYKGEASESVSDKTYQDLDLDEVFMYIDRTVSKVGQQYLYKTLRTSPLNKEYSNHLEHLINTFKNDEKLRESVQVSLYRLNNNNANYITALFQQAHIQPPDWLWMLKFLSLTNFLCLILLPFYPKALLLLLGVLLINYGIHYWNKKNLFLYTNSIPQLIRLSQVAKEIMRHKGLAEDNKRLTDSIRMIDKMSYKMSFFKLESKMESDIGRGLDIVVELIKALFLIEPLLLFNVLREVDSKREEIHTVFAFVGKTDMAISVASLRQGLPYYCQPTIAPESKTMLGQDIYHPLIENPVSNSIELINKSALLTGSNMSGKTTFIRTIGINAILGQTINTCFASKFTMPPLKVFSAIRITDDLMNDKSYYFEEVLTIKEMILQSQSGAQTLFLLDELYKGTNTVERIAAGKAVLSYLNKGNHMVFVSTHDIELTGYMQDTFDLYHFTETIGNEKIEFDYKLKAGSLKTRNAIRILELNQYPAEVIREANELAEQMSKSFMADSHR